jgi:hypothetical protein
MTQDALTKQLGTLADAVRADPRWQQDDLSVEVLCMLLYGFALMTGRSVMFLDVEDIDAAVLRCLTDHVGAAAKWSGGLVTEASTSAMSKAHHSAHHALIGVGHSYMGVENLKAVVDNIFTNIAYTRRYLEGNA